MFAKFFHSPQAAAVSVWLTLATGIFTVLSWLTPEWWGQLTWPQAILAGMAMTLVGALGLAVLLAISAWGFRKLWPLPGSAALPELDHRADTYPDWADYSLLERRVEGLEKAPPAVVMYDDTHLKQELETIRRGCAGLEEKLDKSAAALRESIQAVIVRERLARFADEIQASAKDLYWPLKSGQKYDAERWASWESCHTHWNSVLQSWIDDARWYAKDVKTRIMTVDDKEYDETTWSVTDDQFPNANAVRRFQRYCIIQRHWTDVKADVEHGNMMVTFGSMSERECHGGRYHQ
jgi:hypothetical protein